MFPLLLSFTLFANGWKRNFMTKCQKFQQKKSSGNLVTLSLRTHFLGYIPGDKYLKHHLMARSMLCNICNESLSKIGAYIY